MDDRSPARPEVLSFLGALEDNPDDPTPTLILADWLDEHGNESDRARAECIRLRHAVRISSAGSLELPGLQARIQNLERTWGPRWLGPLHKRVLGASFGPGRCSVRMDVGTFLSQALLALRGTETWAWVGALRLQGARPEMGRRIAACPLLGDLSHLGFSNEGRTELAAGVVFLAASPHLTRLRQLDLTANGLDGACAHALAASPYLGALHDLLLAGNLLDADAGTAFARQLPPRLRLLDLSRNRLGDAGVTALAGSPHLSQLTTLDLSDNRFGPAGALALAQSPYLENLRSLLVFGNRVLTEGAEALRERFGKRVGLAW